MLKYYAAIAVGGVLTAVAQLLLKQGALHGKGKGLRGMVLNPYVMVAYTLLVIMTLANLYALQVLPLLVMVVVFALVQVAVVTGSLLIFGERLSTRQIFGVATIIVGVLVFHAGF